MKKIITILTAVLLLLCSLPASANNPIVKTDGNGNRVYAGDPAVWVEGDTVYLLVGHDVAAVGGGYSMPEWLMYSSSNLIDWKYEGVPLKAGDFSWGSANQSWASQIVKYNGKYYFYMCKSATGMSVGVSDTVTGPYTDAIPGRQLVYPSWTSGKVSWDDIDPTVWIETDEDGVEHRYLCWGNSNCYIAELDETMVSLADENGDGEVNGGDIQEVVINGIPEDNQYTEAPWLYKRGDTYYLFFATNWYEELSYATSKDIRGPYEYGGLVMPTGSSSNTNHPAVFDYNGKTYIIYHTGALESGDGYRRSVCIDELFFNADGSIDAFEESSVGLDGTAVYISPVSEPEKKLYHGHFDNLAESTMYPHGALVYSDNMTEYESDYRWEIIEGRGNEDYVSIQSVNKMGYFITNNNSHIKLLHDEDAAPETTESMTFIEHDGLAGTGVSYESMTERGKYLTVVGDRLILTDGSDKEASSFILTEVKKNDRLSIAKTDDGIKIAGVNNGGAAMVYVENSDGEIVDVKLIREEKIDYTYTPSASGTYTVRFGKLSESVEY